MAHSDDPPPYGAYAGIMGTFVGGIAVAGALARLLDRDPRSDGPLDLVVLGAATFKASRTITRDEVTSFIREPFVEGEAHEGGEHAVETGDLRQAIGELVTCSRCVGTWVAAGLASTQILAPRFGRILTWTLAAAGAERLAAGRLRRADRRSRTSSGQRAGRRVDDRGAGYPAARAPGRSSSSRQRSLRRSSHRPRLAQRRAA